MTRVIMVMGVSGAGKSTVGAGLANTLGAVFLDGDAFHPQKNIDHMAAGNPLTDAMRWPWLDNLAVAVRDTGADSDVVFACSALKRRYRSYLRGAIPGLRVVFLDAPRSVVMARLAQRNDHFMPARQCDDQFATLEVPQDCISVGIDRPASEIVDAVLSQL